PAHHRHRRGRRAEPHPVHGPHVHALGADVRRQLPEPELRRPHLRRDPPARARRAAAAARGHDRAHDRGARGGEPGGVGVDRGVLGVGRAQPARLAGPRGQHDAPARAVRAVREEGAAHADPRPVEPLAGRADLHRRRVGHRAARRVQRGHRALRGRGPGRGHGRRDRADAHGLRAGHSDRRYHREAPLERSVAAPSRRLRLRAPAVRYDPEPERQHGTPAKTGVLLVNLGTPEAPTAAAVRRYLAEFLWDPRVVEIPRALWWPILHGVVLRLRPRASARRYASIWTPEGSPLKVHAEKQAGLLRGHLAPRLRSPLAVETAMRYGTPAIGEALRRLKRDGCDRILVVPLYPQYAASSTASVFDEVAAFVRRARHVPGLRLVRGFHDHPGYIGALAARVRE